MDLNGITNGGVFVPIAALVAAIVVACIVVWIIRRSAAHMAQRNQAWIDQLPVSTGTRAGTRAAHDSPVEGARHSDAHHDTIDTRV